MVAGVRIYGADVVCVSNLQPYGVRIVLGVKCFAVVVWWTCTQSIPSIGSRSVFYFYLFIFITELRPYRSGMAHTLRQQLSRRSASAFNWAISLESDALIRIKLPETILSSSTQTACTASVLTIVPARKPRTRSPNYSGRVGTLPRQPPQSLQPLSTFSSFSTYYLSSPKLPFSNTIIP
jgi:hypothetical protein